MKKKVSSKILLIFLITVILSGLHPLGVLAKGTDSTISHGTIEYYNESKDSPKDKQKDNQKESIQSVPKNGSKDNSTGNGQTSTAKSRLPQTDEKIATTGHGIFFGSMLILISVLFFSKRKKFV